jgi:hypothetical protein
LDFFLGKGELRLEQGLPFSSQSQLFFETLGLLRLPGFFQGCRDILNRVVGLGKTRRQFLLQRFKGLGRGLELYLQGCQFFVRPLHGVRTACRGILGLVRRNQVLPAAAP